MSWPATRGRFVVIAALFVLGWYVSVLVNTNGGWGWNDPEYAVAWRGRGLAIWSAVAGAAVLLAAAAWRPRRWTIVVPALIAGLGLAIRRLYVIGSPPDYFLNDGASARWFLAALCLLQLIAVALTVVPPAGRAVGREGGKAGRREGGKDGKDGKADVE